MKRQQLESVVFNLAGGFIILTVIGYMVTTHFKSQVVPNCSARFAPGQQFSLENSKGNLLSPIELQAQSGSREWGVLNNIQVVKAADAPLGKALVVSLKPTGSEDRPDQNGLGYSWLVGSLAKAHAACLSYSAFIPKGFKFAEPGYLPGLFGGSEAGALDQAQPVGGAVARMGWVEGGELGAEVRTPSSNGFWIGASHTYWPTGHWVAIEQEINLGTVGKSNGVVRVWVDGDLKIDSRDIDLLGSDHFALSGVVSDIGYARTASEPANIKVSPFVVQWQ